MILCVWLLKAIGFAPSVETALATYVDVAVVLVGFVLLSLQLALRKEGLALSSILAAAVVMTSLVAATIKLQLGWDYNPVGT